MAAATLEVAREAGAFAPGAASADRSALHRPFAPGGQRRRLRTMTYNWNLRWNLLCDIGPCRSLAPPPLGSKHPGEPAEPRVPFKAASG